MKELAAMIDELEKYSKGMDAIMDADDFRFKIRAGRTIVDDRQLRLVTRTQFRKELAAARK